MVRALMQSNSKTMHIFKSGAELMKLFPESLPLAPHHLRVATCHYYNVDNRWEVCLYCSPTSESELEPKDR